MAAKIGGSVREANLVLRDVEDYPAFTLGAMLRLAERSMLIEPLAH